MLICGTEGPAGGRWQETASLDSPVTSLWAKAQVSGPRDSRVPHPTPLLFLRPPYTERLQCTGTDSDLPSALPDSGPVGQDKVSRGCLPATLAIQPPPLREPESARTGGTGTRSCTVVGGARHWPLEHHIELSNQEVDVVAVLGLEGLGDDPGSLPVLLATERQPIHLQDHVAHLELPTVVG